jgi:hypothetical protein
MPFDHFPNRTNGVDFMLAPRTPILGAFHFSCYVSFVILLDILRRADASETHRKMGHATDRVDLDIR